MLIIILIRRQPLPVIILKYDPLRFLQIKSFFYI